MLIKFSIWSRWQQEAAAKLAAESQAPGNDALVYASII